MNLKSKKSNFSYNSFDEKSLAKFTAHRDGETRIGECNLFNKQARFVILGIEESIGPIANNGFPGAEFAFNAFLSVFLNSQVHENFEAKDILILGAIQQNSITPSVSQASEQIAELDEFVLKILKENLKENQIPIVIGGGHNNAYPLIKWSALEKKINVINLDPHADCREPNRRHSGNSFSYALNDSLLKNYAVFGLHEAFNNSFILDFLKKNDVNHTFYEDYLDKSRDLTSDFNKLVETWNQKEKIGLEIDMDCIAGMPSSAFSPSGWTLDEVRSYLINATKSVSNIAYLHLPEASPRNDIEKRLVGKALTYLVRDFIRNAK